MNITDHDKERILETFPAFKLSYERKNHKKISLDFFLTIPKGRKYFAWFRHFKKYNVCVFLQLAGKFQIKDVEYLRIIKHRRDWCRFITSNKPKSISSKLQIKSIQRGSKR